MSYFDGFVLAVPAAKKDAYVAMARKVWEESFQKQGALSMVEAWGDDVPEGEHTSFPMAVKKQDDEVVVFSWVEWPDKATRDAAWAANMASDGMGEMPFDGKRMIYGGFTPVVDVRA